MAKILYKCPECKNTVTAHIPTVGGPVCRNHTDHHHKRDVSMKEVVK